MDNNQTTTTENSSPAVVSPAQTITPEVLLKAIAESEKVEQLEEVMGLSAQYVELEKPTEFFKGIYLGLQDITVTDRGTGEMKTIPAARFVINRQVYVNAGAVLISELKRASIPVGTPLKVTYERKEGNVKIYSITLLG